MWFRSFIVLCALALTAISGSAYAQSTDEMYDDTAEYTTEAEAYPDHTDGMFEEAFLDLKRNDSLQFELAEPIEVPPSPKWSRAVGDFINGFFNLISPLLVLLFWIFLGALVLGAIYLIGRTIYESRFAFGRDTDVTDEPEIPLYQPAKAQAQILMDEIDRLASEGKYGEAVHTLLFRSIQDIDRNRPNVVRRSLTAREIGALTVLTPEARTAFSTIAGVSELSHFGGTPIGKAGFDTARAAYSELTGIGGVEPTRRRRS